MSTAIHASQPVPIGPTKSYTEKFQDYLENIKLYNNNKAAASDRVDVGTSGPQGKVVPLTIIDDPADWTAESLKGKEEEYTWTLNDKDVKDIISATEKITARLPATEDSVKNLTKEDYDWPEFSSKLLETVKNVSLGRGFHLVRGFPVEHFRGNRFGLVVAFWGLALELGVPQISQTDYDREHNTFGSLLNHISNGRHTTVKGKDVYPQNAPKSDGAKKEVNVNETRIHFHSDQGATDLIALLSLNKAKEGGESKWVSALAIHNELLRRGRKDLVEALSTKGIWKVPRKFDQASYARDKDGNHTGFEDDPPLVYHEGENGGTFVSAHFSSPAYQEIDLMPVQKEAVWTFAAIAEDPKFYLAKTFEPGDIEIISNQIVLHSRGEVHNGVVPHENRQLLRWWVAQPKERNPRGVIPSFAPRSNVRAEGGFAYPGDDKATVRLPFYPYSANDGEGQSEW